MSVIISIYPYCPDQFAGLAKKWLLIEQQVDGHFFLSWAWISSWLTTITSDCYLIEAQEDHQCVGLAILAQSSRTAFGFIPIKQLFLHRTGKVEFDQSWIEYNNLLALNTEVKSQMINAIINKLTWHELIIGVAEKEVFSLFEQTKLKSHTLFKSEGYLINFTELNSEYSKEVLSKNSRQKLNKNRRLLQRFGEVSFQIFTENEDVLLRFGCIADFHRQRWGNTETKSGFDNPYFCHFLKKLINNNDNVQTHLACLSVDGKEVAYLLNFEANNKVYFYLSAIDSKFAPNVNKGLLIHYQAIEFYYNNGIAQYDLLLGEHRYKKSLANRQYKQQMKCYYQNSFFLSFEYLLRHIKANTISLYSALISNLKSLLKIRAK